MGGYYMPSFKYVIELSDQDKATLMEIVKKGNSPARTILRANILLASDKRNDKHMTVSEIADAYHTTPTTVQTVRTSYCEKGLEATINRRKRETPPIPAKVTGGGGGTRHCTCLRTAAGGVFKVDTTAACEQNG